METRKYFFCGAIGLIFGQAAGFLISIILGQAAGPVISNFSMTREISLVLHLTIVWSIFGIYTGLLWNRGLKYGTLGVVSGFLIGILWYSQVTPFIEEVSIMILPALLFSLFLFASMVSENKLNRKNLYLFILIALAIVIFSNIQKYSNILENKFTGVIPGLIGFFSFVVPIVILGGLINVGLYYTSGSSVTNKNGFKNTFLKLGKIFSFFWILFMLFFALGSSHDPRYSISKINETEYSVFFDTTEINRYPHFARAINEMEKSGKEEYLSEAVPAEEWNTLRDLCGAKGAEVTGKCNFGINNSFYDVKFPTP